MCGGDPVLVYQPLSGRECFLYAGSFRAGYDSLPVQLRSQFMLADISDLVDFGKRR